MAARSRSALGEPHFAWDEIPLTYPMDTARAAAGLGRARASDGAQRRQPAPGLLRARRSRSVDLDELGPSIEHDPAFPERINVNVATVRDDGIHLRTWERGAG